MEGNKYFGWKTMLKDTKIKNVIFDAFFPFVVSLLLCFFMWVYNKDVLLELKKLLSICITVIPIIVTLILTAYTILTVFITGEKFASIKYTKNGETLIRSLNSSFAFSLAISIITMILSILVSLIAHMEMLYEYASYVNYIVYFCVCLFSLYSIYSLFGIVVDIYNCGQTALIDTQSENK